MGTDDLAFMPSSAERDVLSDVHLQIQKDGDSRHGWLHRVQDRDRDELPPAVPGIDPFHVVRLAGDGLD